VKTGRTDRTTKRTKDTKKLAEGDEQDGDKTSRGSWKEMAENWQRKQRKTRKMVNKIIVSKMEERLTEKKQSKTEIQKCSTILVSIMADNWQRDSEGRQYRSWARS
jgi:hypothetical protein